MSREIPVKTVHLFPVLDQLLIDLLNSLSSDDWSKSTLAKLWNVKDIAAHLLDGNVRALSSRHQFVNEEQPIINSYHDLVDYLNQLNATWVKAMKRVSPPMLTQLLQVTGKQYCEYIASLNMFETARFSVAWAGEEHSLNWFHIAREYTEKWHHQQQIREAVGKQGIMHRELFYPCIETFMYALPYTYRNVEAENNTVIAITISGNAGGNWYLQRENDGWVLKTDKNKPADAQVKMSPDIAWKLFTKGITSDFAFKNSITGGDVKLATPIFNMVSVMV
ncbi:maleylpyruvate isomerase N-terminal domain-containing protein [Mucilaginibacter aquaedulcis]|uniref:maleylpyruvate isomerase N-terminal domain-containing protein n=1 Tax=Mucilaginibacter aquaedulcis TaxID=1187081 RepID=UPI0025B598A4|nr:maleylpyruvate isomerase N-terminal domain-containing protein [Mucilaginibacter aquaedulcis]MDN3548019.1 maleylpyruvate isomerase N-terminal domain-containing protein [Mucilaginibacter aquaedulcis]